VVSCCRWDAGCPLTASDFSIGQARGASRYERTATVNIPDLTNHIQVVY
jgi:hypothetical protein